LTVNRQLALGIDYSLVAKQPSFLSAINLCVDLSGFSDDEIAKDLEIAIAQFSRIRKGSAHFPPNKIMQLMDYCGNEVPLQWLAIKRHYQLMPTMSAMEKRLSDRDEEIAHLTQKLNHFKEFMAAK